jgi:NhaP-type Na+/H+ or K+/H+ antiporter
MNKLIRDLFYACAAGALLGSAIGLLIRWHRERRAAFGHSPVKHAPALATRWHGRNPNSIG